MTPAVFPRATLRRPFVVLALAALGGDCTASPPAPVFATASSTIVLTPDGRSLWITSPDDNTVVQIDPVALTVTTTLSLPGSPEQLALVGTRLAVSFAQTGDVAIVNLSSSPPSVTRVPVPCGGTRAVVAESASTEAFVIFACPNDDLLVEVDPVAGVVTRVIPSPGRPTALAVAGNVLTVSASRVGQLQALSLNAIATLPSGAAVTPWPSPAAPDGLVLDSVALVNTPGFAATQVDALAAEPSGGRVFATFQHVDNDSNRDLPPEDGGYGAVMNGTPRIEPRLFAACGSRFAHFDGGPTAMSGPSALAYDNVRGLLWVVGMYTDNVVALRCPLPEAPLDPANAYLRTQAHPATDDTFLADAVAFAVGRAPRGIVLAPDGATAWVDEGFDHAVARLALPTATLPIATVQSPALELRRSLGPTDLSATALAGRSLFFNATDTHLTPSGVLTCGTCHPDGGEDGLDWFVHTTTVPRKFRRTPPAWGARSDATLLHWDGSFHDAATLSEATILALLEGDGLLVDTGALSAWMAAMPTPPPRSLTPAEQTSAAHGEVLFNSSTVGCANCHNGPRLADNMLHSVVAPSSDPDGLLAMVRTPTLVGVRTRPPYLHDGRAPTLMDVLTTYNAGDTHGVTSGLATQDLADLAMYLQSL